MFSFSTSSSSATIPVTLQCVKNQFSVKENIASFTIPLGATINMDGTAIMQGVATVFIANLYGIDLFFTDYVSIILTATLASIGTAGVPGVGIIMLGMVLNQVGLPLEGIAIVMGVDRFLDMLRTSVNITGDAMVSIVVNKAKKKMKWFEIELEIPIYGKSFEIVQAFDSETAIQIAIKKTVNQFNIMSHNVSIILVKEINNQI